MRENWPRYLYTLAYYVLVPVILLRLLWRARKAPGYLRRWGERFGYVPAIELPGDQENLIWVHAVSVGETLAAIPLINGLRQHYSEFKIMVTTTTPTGSDRVKAAFGDSVYHSYAPYDLPGAVNRFIGKVAPSMLVIMETELWPNLIHHCRRRDIPVIVANARLSERSANGYRRVSWLTGPMLRKLSKIAVQTEPERQRFAALGAPPETLEVTGNIKFDVQLSDQLGHNALQLKEQLRGSRRRPVLLAASTHRGEDDILLDAFMQLREQFGDLLLVIVPRHPERFAEVGRLVESKGLSIARRSLKQLPGDGQQVMLGDSMGELMLFYGASDIAFVGGSLVPVGGHNLMEPAAWGLPIICGPHLFNFAEVSQLLCQADALQICADSDAIAASVNPLLKDPEKCRQKGVAARAVIHQNQGALEKLLRCVGEQLPMAARTP